MVEGLLLMDVSLSQTPLAARSKQEMEHLIQKLKYAVKGTLNICYGIVYFLWGLESDL